MDWASSGTPIWWHDETSKPVTEQESREWVKANQQTANEKKQRQADAAKVAKETLAKARLAWHPYLKSKGFPEEYGLVLDDTLLIPMSNYQTHKLAGYQAITEVNGKWEKKMLYGMKAKEAVFCLGPRQKEVWLVEGYATALSVRTALKQLQLQAQVICCFSASNMIEISKLLPPECVAYVFADNDKSETGVKSALATNLPFTVADTVGWDANDVHQHQGIFSVCKYIMDLRLNNRERKHG